MKTIFEDKDLLSLVRWLKIFKREFKVIEFVNLSQLIGTDFLDNIMYLIKKFTEDTLFKPYVLMGPTWLVWFHSTNDDDDKRQIFKITLV